MTSSSNKVKENFFPRGCFTIFGSEMALKLCLWGVQSILILFFTRQLGFTDSLSYSIVASFGALSYLLTFWGGYIADKYFGPLRILMIGMVFSAVGSFLLMAATTPSLCYLGLSLLIIGMGFYIPTNASLLDNLYDKTNPTRERGYFYLYVASNTGGILGPWLLGYIALQISFSAAFFLSGILLFLFLLPYFRVQKKATFFHLSASSTKKTPLLQWIYFVIGLIVCATSIFLLITNSHLTRDLLVLGGIGAFIWIFLKSRQETPLAKKKINLSLFFSMVSLVFFAAEFQILTSCITFIRDFVDKEVLGYSVPTSSFVAFEPFFVVLSAPLINFFIEWLERKNIVLSIMHKFSISFILIALSFGVLSFGAYQYNETHQLISSFWILAMNFFMGAGEAFLMPVLLASVTKESPEKMKNSMVGFLYLCLAFSSDLSGVIANVSQSLNTQTIILGYAFTYQALFWMLLGIGVVLLLLNKVIVLPVKEHA